MVFELLRRFVETVRLAPGGVVRGCRADIAFSIHAR